MYKEHLETDLTIQAFYKVGYILELTHLHIAPFSVTRKYNTYSCMGEIFYESRSAHNFNVLRALLYKHFYVYMTINSLNIIEK